MNHKNIFINGCKIGLLFLAILLVSGCIGSSTPTCNTPYILVGEDCCLDENDDNICDKDKPLTTTLSTSSSSTRPATSTTSTSSTTLKPDSCENVCKINYGQYGSCVQNGAQCSSKNSHIEFEGHTFCKAESRVYDLCCCIDNSEIKSQTTSLTLYTTSYSPSTTITKTSYSASSSSSSGSCAYVGSVNSNIYHYQSCRWAKKITPENEICFSSIADAKSKGYRACKVCHPPS